MDDPLLEPLIAAATLALAEFAATALEVRAVARRPEPPAPGQIDAVLDLTSGPGRALILSVPGATANALAARVLDGVAPAPEAGLVRDCIGEIANVIAGQAKALLAGTPYHFTFATPRIATAGPADPAGDGLVVAFESDAGGLSLQFRRPPVGEPREEA